MILVVTWVSPVVYLLFSLDSSSNWQTFLRFQFIGGGGSGDSSGGDGGGGGWYETAWPWKFARQKTSSWRVLEWWQIQEIIVEQCWIPINQDCWQQKNCLIVCSSLACLAWCGLLGLVWPAWLGLDMTGCKNASLTRAILAFLSVL